MLKNDKNKSPHSTEPDEKQAGCFILLTDKTSSISPCELAIWDTQSLELEAYHFYEYKNRCVLQIKLYLIGY